MDGVQGDWPHPKSRDGGKRLDTATRENDCLGKPVAFYWRHRVGVN